MRTSVTVANTRRVLCVFPAYAPSFGTFSHAYKLMRACAPSCRRRGSSSPLMPAQWPVRFVDENIKAAASRPRLG
jgi:hypothetical protein